MSLLSSLATPGAAATTQVFASPTGSDTNPGTLESPVASLQRAREIAREQVKKGESVYVNLRAGRYYLSRPLVFTSEDSAKGAAFNIWTSFSGENVTLSGGRLIRPDWKTYRDGIMMAELPEVKAGKLDFDQLFVNGELQQMARYPNYDPNARNYNGVAADCISPERVKDGRTLSEDSSTPCTRMSGAISIM